MLRQEKNESVHKSIINLCYIRCKIRMPIFYYYKITAIICENTTAESCQKAMKCEREGLEIKKEIRFLEEEAMDALKILVVDDESRMRKLVRDFLSKKNFQVLEAGDGEEAMDIFYKEKDIALIILDVMMPKMDGWEVCREIRKNSKIPIIMLTARGDERDELLGFDLGVDEYISKPFSPKILVARVEAILRRTGQSAAEDILSAGGIVIDKAAHQASVDGRPMDLSFKEFELLTYFLENEGIALSREKILNSVWNYDYFGDARTIDTHVKKLRSKMGEKGEYIRTVWGMGYKFEVEP